MTDTSGLDAQLEAMERELLAEANLSRKVQAYLHLQAAKRLLVAAGGEIGKRSPPFAPSDDDGWSMPRGISPARGVGKINRPVDPDRVKVLEHARNLIRGRAAPTKTAEIYDNLPEDIRSGIRGEAPKSNLSAMLHNSSAFISHGRAGWTLAPAVPASPAEAVEQQREDAARSPRGAFERFYRPSQDREAPLSAPEETKRIIG